MSDCERTWSDRDTNQSSDKLGRSTSHRTRFPPKVAAVAAVETSKEALGGVQRSSSRDRYKLTDQKFPQPSSDEVRADVQSFMKALNDDQQRNLDEEWARKRNLNFGGYMIKRDPTDVSLQFSNKGTTADPEALPGTKSTYTDANSQPGSETNQRIDDLNRELATAKTTIRQLQAYNTLLEARVKDFQDASKAKQSTARHVPSMAKPSNAAGVSKLEQDAESDLLL